MKIEVDFEEQHETGEPIAKFIGRINIGGHVGQLYFRPSGETVLFIDGGAIDDGSIVLGKQYDKAAYSG